MSSIVTPWLEDHVSEVADALMSRMNREACSGITRRWQMIYCPSQPGTRGGLAVIPSDDCLPEQWLPVQGILSNAASMTRDQIRAQIYQASRRLPVLDPNEA